MSVRIILVMLCVIAGAVHPQATGQTPDQLFMRAKALIEENASPEEGDRAKYAEGAKLMRQAIAAGCSDQATAYKLLARALGSLLADIPYDSPELPAAEAEVRKTYQQAIALDPTDLETRLRYSDTLDSESARRQVLEQILELDPRYSAALRAYGELLYRQGDVETGLAKWRESVEVATNALDIEDNGDDLVQVLEARGRTQEAEAVKQLMKTKLNEPTRLELLTGDNQEGRVGTTVNRLAVEVWSLGGEYAPGQLVTFAVTGGSGSLSAAQATTGADGVAATILTLGDTPGLVTVEARWRDQTVVFRITAVR